MKVELDDFINKITVDSDTWRDTYSGETVIHRLIKENRFEDFKSVVEENYKPTRLLGDSLLTIPDKGGVLPLHRAIAENRQEFVDYLLLHQPLLKAKDREGKTAFHYSVLSKVKGLEKLEPSPLWILAKRNKEKLLIHVCHLLDDYTLRLIKSKMKKHKISMVKIYSHHDDPVGFTEDLPLRMVVGSLDSVGEYIFDQYLES